MTEFSLFIALIAFLVFVYKRQLRYLHIFQQEEYDNPRFLSWIFRTHSYDKRLSLIVIVVAIAALTIGPLYIFYFALAVLFLVFSYLEPNPLQLAKKKLVLTQRANRIFRLSLVLNLVVLLELYFQSFFFFLVCVHFIPVTLMIANMLLRPLEKSIQDKFKNEAVTKFERIQPETIAITGSFGKTSTKLVLGHILQLNTHAYFPPGSINTVMGITRMIREKMADNCKYFVTEMGAYGEGSINRLCDFTPPDHGIITAIGAAHFERFKDLETTAKAKFELATRVISRGGKVVIAEGVLNSNYAKTYVKDKREHFIIVGEGDDVDAKIMSVEQTEKGIGIDINYNGETYSISAPIFGKHHASNISLAFVMACFIGIKPEMIKVALKSTPQIKHRLEVKSYINGSQVIDDAYNSNPQGFRNAINLLDLLNTKNGRKILVTPGMVELGDLHDKEHTEIGRIASEKVDITLLIKGERIPTFADAYNNSKNGAELIELPSFEDAKAWLQENVTAADVVLLENDLPDLYEQKLTL